MKKILPCVLAAVAVLALLILVPTSPALLVDDPQTLLFLQTGTDEWGDPTGLPITVYSLFIAAGTAIAITLTALLLKRHTGSKEGVSLALVSGVSALVCSHLLFCVLRWGYIVNDLCENATFLFQFWKGGYTMYGAILGGLLGAAAYARVRRLNLGAALDAILPGAAVILLLGRFAERFTLQGLGNYVVNDSLHMLPFVTANEWGEMKVPVYLYEALAAAIALIVMLLVQRRSQQPGRTAEIGLTIISAAQVMLDSWRGDELIRFGFVRLNMIIAAVMLLCLMILRVYRAVKAGGVQPWTIIRVALLFLGAAAVLIVEFGLDGKMGITLDNVYLYAIQLLSVLLMGAVVLIDDWKGLAGLRKDRV